MAIGQRIPLIVVQASECSFGDCSKLVDNLKNYTMYNVYVRAVNIEKGEPTKANATTIETGKKLPISNFKMDYLLLHFCNIHFTEIIYLTLVL